MKIKNFLYGFTILIIVTLLSLEYVSLRYPDKTESEEKVFGQWSATEYENAKEKANMFYLSLRLNEIVEYYNYIPYDERFAEDIREGFTEDDIIILKVNFSIQDYKRYIILYKTSFDRWEVMSDGIF